MFFTIVQGVLGLSFGLLWDKVRDHTAERFRDGDVTDEECRQFIVRELDSMKSMLEGLSRKDLLASISFLKEGVCLLNTALSHAVTDDDQKRCELPQENSGNVADCSNEMADIATSSGKSRPVEQNHYEHERFEEAVKQLSRTTEKLDIASKNCLSFARMSFADARREATRAFNNQALSIKSRILACKLRVISRMLESVEYPMAVVETCVLYLEELHKLEAIENIFDVHINSRLRSRFNKKKRQELMSSVIMINYVLANFTLSFAKKKYNLFNWPKVEISRGEFHPLLHTAAKDIMHSSKIAAPNIFGFDRINSPEVKQLDRQIMPRINSTGSGHITEILIRDGVMQLCFSSSSDEIATENPRMLLVITDDGKDRIYVVVYVVVSAGKFEFSLLVADRTGTITCEADLEFLADAEKKYRESVLSDEIEEFFSNSPTHVEFTANAGANKLIFGHQSYIYICDMNGLLSHCFETTDRNDLVCKTHNGDVITAEHTSNTIYIYFLNGTMKHKFDVDRGQIICDVVSHHTSHMIYALTRNFQKKEEFHLEIYTNLGERRGKLDLVGSNFLTLFALQEGPVAVIYNKGFILV